MAVGGGQRIVLLTHSEIYRKILSNGQRTAIPYPELHYEDLLKQTDFQILVQNSGQRTVMESALGFKISNSRDQLRLSQPDRLSV